MIVRASFYWRQHGAVDGTMARQSESVGALPGSAIDLLGGWDESFNLFLFAFVYLGCKDFEDETCCVCTYSAEHNRVLLHTGTNVLSPTVREMNPE